MDGHEEKHPEPTPAETPGDQRLEWKTPELFAEEITGVTEGNPGAFLIPPDRGSLYDS